MHVIPGHCTEAFKNSHQAFLLCSTEKKKKCCLVLIPQVCFSVLTIFLSPETSSIESQWVCQSRLKTTASSLGKLNHLQELYIVKGHPVLMGTSFLASLGGPLCALHPGA